MSRRLILVVLVIAGGMAHAGAPRSADLTRFDADRMARAEAGMWRDYYEKAYLKLFAGLYEVARREFGFSPWDSFCVALSAARAARAFQPTTSRAEANAALPLLRDYYGVLARAAPVPVDVDRVAREELGTGGRRAASRAGPISTA